MKASTKHIFILGFALFAMFFGAGNLIFPPLLGRMAQGDFWPAMMGFWVTGIGLPLLGIIAVAKCGGGIGKMAGPVGRIFSIVMVAVTIIILGPAFVVPRTCATTYELAILPNTLLINSWVFSFFYFSIVLFFSLNPSSVVDRIGKYLTPGLGIALTSLIVMGIIHPIAAIPERGLPNAFGVGFLEGYQTMDLIAATLFGIILLNAVRDKDYFAGKSPVKPVVLAGIIAAVCLAFIYGGLLYLGATTGSIADDFTRIELLTFMSGEILGVFGKFALAAAVSFACLTTSIALTVICAKYTTKLIKGKIGYKMLCVLISIVSLLISNLGVGSIVKFAIPPLVAIYPVIVVLVALSLLSGFIKNHNVYRGAVIGAFIVGLIKAGIFIYPESRALIDFHQMIPLSSLGMGWVIPAIAFGALGYFIKLPSRERRFNV